MNHPLKKYSIKILTLLKKIWNYPESKERVIHHDSRPGSYYYESQRALREKREDYLK